MGGSLVGWVGVLVKKGHPGPGLSAGTDVEKGEAEKGPVSGPDIYVFFYVWYIWVSSAKVRP